LKLLAMAKLQALDKVLDLVQVTYHNLTYTI